MSFRNGVSAPTSSATCGWTWGARAVSGASRTCSGERGTYAGFVGVGQQRDELAERLHDVRFGYIGSACRLALDAETGVCALVRDGGIPGKEESGEGCIPGYMATSCKGLSVTEM